MTLAEKIAALRGERKLSQGDLAEKLDVSRQSVSKWETGQAVPELEKIIKLADLFGVTVDELVRDGEMPRPEAPGPEAPKSEAAERVVYVKQRFTAVQTLGIILIVGGLAAILCAMLIESEWLLIFGGALFILGLPLLLAGKRHPFLIVGWLMWLAGNLTLFNPMIGGGIWEPLRGFAIWWHWVKNAEEYMRGPAGVLFAFAYLGVAVLTIVLPLYTGWLCFKKWKGRREDKSKDAA